MGGIWSNQSQTFPLIDQHIKEHCVVVYSTTVCGFCTKAKRLLAESNIDYNVVEINELTPKYGGAVTQELIQKTNTRTVSGYCYCIKYWTVFLIWGKADHTSSSF